MLQITEITLSNLVSCVNSLHSTLSALSTACLCKHSVRLFNNSLIETETLLKFLKTIPELENGQWKPVRGREKVRTNCNSDHQNNSSFTREGCFQESVDVNKSREDNELEAVDNELSLDECQESNLGEIENGTDSSFSILEVEDLEVASECEQSASNSDSGEEKSIGKLETNLNELDQKITTLFEDISSKYDSRSSDDTDSVSTDGSIPLLKQAIRNKKYQDMIANRPSTAASDLPIHGKLKFLAEDVDSLLQRVDSKKREVAKRKEAFDDRLSDLKNGRNLTASNVIPEDNSSRSSVSSLKTDSTTISTLSLRSDSFRSVSQSSSTDTVIGDDLVKMEEELDLISANLDDILALTGLNKNPV